MPTIVTSTAITPEWQNVSRKVFTDILTGGNANTRALNLIYGEKPRAYTKNLYEFKRKYKANSAVPQVLRGGEYINVSGKKEVIAQFNPLIYKLQSSYSVVDLQNAGSNMVDTEAKLPFRAEEVADHVKMIQQSLNDTAIVSIRGGKVQTPIYTQNGTIYTDQNYGLIWSDSVGTGAFPTRMQTGVTMTNVDWGNASTTLAVIEENISLIFQAAEEKGINPDDLEIRIGTDTFAAIGAKIDAFISTSKRAGGLDYAVNRIDGVIVLGNKILKRYNISTIINSTTYKFVEDKYITVALKPQYNDWVYMCPENIKLMNTPIDYFSKELLSHNEENWEVYTQSRQFVCPDTNGIWTVKVIA